MAELSGILNTQSGQSRGSGQPNVNLRGKKSLFSGLTPLPKLDPCYLVLSYDGIRETLPALQLPPPC